MIPTTDHIKL